MNPNYIAAALALAFVAWVALYQRPAASGGGEITTEDGEGGALDVGGLLNQAQGLVTGGGDGWNNPAGMSSDGLAALMQREGFSATAYPDHKGMSIGYGHQLRPGEDFGTIGQAQAADLLAVDVGWAVDAVRSNVTVPLSQAQFDALVSFAYNVGAGAFARSTLVRRLNRYDPEASTEFDRWVYASGQVNAGLVARRASERAQFES